MFSALRIVCISDICKSFTKLIPRCSLKLSRNSSGCCGDLKFNYSEECEKQLNVQINQELFASYSYLAMACHFEHPTVALAGFYTMFLFFSREETEHARKLIEFQNKRGGKVQYTAIEPPTNSDWTPESAVVSALNLEKCVTQNLHVLHEKGAKHNDCHLCDFVESVYLQEQYEAIKELNKLLTKLKRMKDGIGIQILDNELHHEFKNKKIQGYAL